MRNNVFILDDLIFDGHDTGAEHPECIQRLQVCRAALADLPRSSVPQRASIEALSRVHHIAYIRRVLAQQGRYGSAGPEASLSPGSVEAALAAAGAAIAGVERVLKGERGFVLCRPPGHHARPASGMGFCVFNNIAVAAAHARHLGLQRVMIVDWDVHHGNGTQEIFYRDPSVFFFSLHQSPLYPDSGLADERGAGAGLNYTRNVPMLAGSDDADYAAVFSGILAQEMEMFKPELILVSAGFDAHQGDPLAGMWLTAAGYGQLCRQLCTFADQYASGRILLLLEGGYRLDTLGACVRACMEAL